MNETQAKILDAAEYEFAESGFGGASIRAITKRAGVNIAAINYHFGSKKDLFFQMVIRRIEPINAERLARLDSALAASGGSPLPLEQTLTILVHPLLEQLITHAEGSFHFLRAMGRGMTEQAELMTALHESVLKEVIARFSAQISRSLGQPSFSSLAYGMHLLSCVITGSMMQHQRLKEFSCNEIDLADVDSHCRHLVAFISGGLRAVAAMNQTP